MTPSSTDTLAHLLFTDHYFRRFNDRYYIVPCFQVQILSRGKGNSRNNFLAIWQFDYDLCHDRTRLYCFDFTFQLITGTHFHSGWRTPFECEICVLR
jgi:hypothetical protein